jgi:hypothetical protein
MKTFVSPAVFACLMLGACAQPQPPAQTADAAPAEKPACNRSDSNTGSHIVDRHDCSRGPALSMSGEATATAMRQANPGSILSH